ncbi:hypothetical protein [Halochromatium glycolicum]|uniref:Uncharacterized protein n=1 Tax=Halochromatium glycolicum TaxID=85075 RepID=A0AAJ0U189_9GAMM|nr:hypothetical protein [Halochromatium glycolicum]MBK1703000.1 hypothetical protein [Halochromatium glycolicum]
MIGATAPAWLLGLLLFPLLRELHRRRGSQLRIPVPALFLWRGAPSMERSGYRRARPDPIWRRRALLLGLLLLALAGPVWRAQPLGPSMAMMPRSGALPEDVNLAVAALSARPALIRPEMLAVRVTLSGDFSAAGPRMLQVRLDGRELLRQAVDREAGKSWAAVLEIPRPMEDGAAAALQARLLFADTGSMDDRLTLDLGPLRRLSVRLDPRCADPMRAALEATGRIDQGLAAAPELQIRCGGSSPPSSAGGAPLLWFAAPAEGARSVTPPLWTVPDAERPGFEIGPGWRAVSPNPMPPGDVLLIGNGQPLIIAQGEPKRLLVLLDIADPQLAAGAELPLLLDWLIARLTGTLATDGVVAASLTAAERMQDLERSSAALMTRRSALDLAFIPLLPALILAMLEAITGGRRWSR